MSPETRRVGARIGEWFCWVGAAFGLAKLAWSLIAFSTVLSVVLQAGGLWFFVMMAQGFRLRAQIPREERYAVGAVGRDGHVGRPGLEPGT